MARNGPDLRCSVAAGNGIERDLQNTRDGIDITTQGSCFNLYHYASLVSTLYHAVVSISDTVPYIEFDYILPRLAKAHFQCNLNFPSSSFHHLSDPSLPVLEVHSRNATFLIFLQLFLICLPFSPMILPELYCD